MKWRWEVSDDLVEKPRQQLLRLNDCECEPRSAPSSREAYPGPGWVGASYVWGCQHGRSWAWDDTAGWIELEELSA
jgi:hypothetical protein